MCKKTLFIILTLFFLFFSLFFCFKFMSEFIVISYSWKFYGKYIIVLLIPIFGFFENLLIWQRVNVIHNGQIIAPISLGLLFGLVIYVSL